VTIFTIGAFVIESEGVALARILLVNINLTWKVLTKVKTYITI